MTKETTDLAKKEARPLTIRQMIEGDAFKDQIAKALPKHLTPDRFIRIAVTAMMRTPKLADCDQASLFNALLNLSQLGIEPDGRRAHLIPFTNRRRNCVECQLIIDYKGLVELIMRSGKVANIHADVICKNDSFEYDKGMVVSHKINFEQPRGDVYAVYSICRFKDGTEKSEVMTKAEVEAIRNRSKAGQSGPWCTDWNEMAKKTVFRRLAKWLPLSPEYRDALEVDDDKLDHIDAKFAVPAPEKPVKLFETKVAEQTVEPETTFPAPETATPTDGDSTTEQAEELKLEPEKEKPKTKNFKFLQNMAEIKKKIGNKEYYKMLGTHGYEHANEIDTQGQQEIVYHILEQSVVQE